MVMSVAHVCLASLGGRRGLQIILQPPYLWSLYTCSPKAQPPKGIIQESLILQPSCPNYSQRTKTCFGCAMILTTWNDNIPTCYICYIYSYQMTQDSKIKTPAAVTKQAIKWVLSFQYKFVGSVELSHWNSAQQLCQQNIVLINNWN